MNSMPGCDRCLIFSVLPFLIVFSVLYFTTPRPTTVNNNPLSSETKLPSQPSDSPLTTTKTSTVVITNRRKYNPFNASDLRPFSELEPFQFNLPRRISNLTRDGLRCRLRSLLLATLACARNVETHIEKFQNHIETIVDLFHPSSSRLQVLESDSTGEELEKLYRLSRVQVYTRNQLFTIYQK